MLTMFTVFTITFPKNKYPSHEHDWGTFYREGNLFQ